MSTDETSRTLLVTAHPDPGSLTHYIAERLSTALRPGAVEAADLHQEGFDPGSPRRTVAPTRRAAATHPTWFASSSAWIGRPTSFSFSLCTGGPYQPS